MDIQANRRAVGELNQLYADMQEATYGQSAGQELASREKRDDAAGAPRAKKRFKVSDADKKYNTPAYQRYKAGNPAYTKEDIGGLEVTEFGEGIVKKEVKALKKGAETLKGKDIAKADKIAEMTAVNQLTKIYTDMQEAIGEGDPQDDAVKQYVKFSSKKKQSHNKSTSQGQRMGGKSTIYKEEEELQEKQKDTPDQVKAVIAYDKARKGTDDATYDSEHGKKKQAKKERDYAKWQRDKGAEDAQQSGHPWEHAKGSTREKAGKNSEKHAHIKDSYEVLPVKSIEDMTKIYIEGVVKKELKDLKKGAETLKGKDIKKADEIADSFVPSETVSKLAESGHFSVEELWKIVEVEEGYQRNPEKGEEEERKAEKRRKESGRMPPRGDKRREDFERWYAANVR